MEVAVNNSKAALNVLHKRKLVVGKPLIYTGLSRGREGGGEGEGRE